MPIDDELIAKLSAASRVEGSELSSQDISQIASAYSTIDGLSDSYRNFKRDTILEEAYRKEGGIDGEFNYVAKFLRQRTELANLEDDELLVLDDQGNQLLVADNGRSRPATPVDLIRELRTSAAGFDSHFAFQGAEESLAPGYEMSPWERLAEQRSKAAMR